MFKARYSRIDQRKSKRLSACPWRKESIISRDAAIQESISAGIRSTLSLSVASLFLKVFIQELSGTGIYKLFQLSSCVSKYRDSERQRRIAKRRAELIRGRVRISALLSKNRSAQKSKRLSACPWLSSFLRALPSKNQ